MSPWWIPILILGAYAQLALIAVAVIELCGFGNRRPR